MGLVDSYRRTLEVTELEARLAVDPADAAINISLYGKASFKEKLEAAIGTLDATSEAYEHEKHEIEFAIDQFAIETIPDSVASFHAAFEPTPVEVTELGAAVDPS